MKRTPRPHGMGTALLLACSAAWAISNNTLAAAADSGTDASATAVTGLPASLRSSPRLQRVDRLRRQRHGGVSLQAGDEWALPEGHGGARGGDTATQGTASTTLPPLSGTATVPGLVPGPARPPSASIVIAVTSKASSQKRRAWMRRQHASALARLQTSGDPVAAAAGEAVVTRFVLGAHGLRDADLEAVTAENATHGDLLLLPVPDVDDPDPPVDRRAASATTLKVAHAAEWATRQYTAFPWFVRLGDDSYFRFDYFLQHAAGDLPMSGMLLGYCDGMAGRRVAGSLPVARATAPYCSGMGFILTHDAVAFVARNLATLDMSYPEDLTVGSWFVGTNIALVHDDRFTDWEWQACSRKSIIIHKHGGQEAVDEADGSMPSCFG